MELSVTKHRILIEALKLFSQNGPECKAEALKIIEAHISHFFTLYSNKGESHI